MLDYMKCLRMVMATIEFNIENSKEVKRASEIFIFSI
jgi:hypothetical protein